MRTDITIKRKPVKLSPEEFNFKMAQIKKAKINYSIEKYGINIHVKTNKHNYVASLTGEVAYEPASATISRQFHNMTNYHYLENDITEENKHPYGYKVMNCPNNKTRIDWDYRSAAGYGFVDEYYAKKPLKVWTYDINSSFGYAMLQKMPDTHAIPRYNDLVKENEMGFFIGGYCTTTVGRRADIIFPLIESPFKEYVYKYYEIKKNAPLESNQRKEAKYALNIPTGCLQRHNIFLRNAVIHYANKYIKSFIDENTVYCNVDSIYSLVPRPDIPVGPELGQFKLEHENEYFRFIRRGIYQIGEEKHYQGINQLLVDTIDSPTINREAYKKFEYIFDDDKEIFIKNEKIKDSNI